MKTKDESEGKKKEISAWAVKLCQCQNIQKPSNSQARYYNVNIPRFLMPSFPHLCSNSISH